jgi:spermidine/putrescine ABC transporter ATP-binding subunit
MSVQFKRRNTASNCQMSAPPVRRATSASDDLSLGGSKGAAASIEVRELTKRYGNVIAADGVSLSIPAGGFLALLGPSGSGKTTILMSVAGFERPDAGRILIGREDITDIAPYRRGIGMVFQKYALFPHMTVAENVAYPLRQRGVGRAEREERVRESLDLVRLEGLGSRLPAQLSGGQQQRVALARALVYRPPVLLMDEPLGALDRKLREQLQIELKQLQRNLGTTVIFVTHDQQEALSLADRVAVLNQGRVVQVGTPNELHDTPATSFVADFIGEANVLRGIAAATSGMECFIRLANGITFRGTLIGRVEGINSFSAELVIRPSRVKLSRGDTKDQAHGKVMETVYAGETIAILVDLGHGSVLMTRQPAADSSWSVGDLVSVSWAPEDARIFPASDQSKSN